jgi:hypothetical protein
MKIRVVMASLTLCTLLSGSARADTPVIVSREGMQQHARRLLRTLAGLVQQLGQSAVMRALPEGQQATATLARLLGPARELVRMIHAAPITNPHATVVTVTQPVVVPQPVVVAPPPPPPPEPPPPPPGPTAISEADLNRIIGAVRAESFSREQLSVLQSAVGSHHFTISQVPRILELFSFSRDQLEALRHLAPRILDKQNGFELFRIFRFRSDKRVAKEILGQ